jgi:hypothetical protein
LLGFISFQGDTMTSDKQLLEQALEALENATTYGSLTGADWVFDQVDNAIITIKQALAAPVQEPCNHNESVPATVCKRCLCIVPTPEAQPAPVQEPVAWRTVHKAVVAAIEACKAASGMHRAIDLVVNAAQITHDTLGTDITSPTYDQGWKEGYKHGAWANTAAPMQEPVVTANKLSGLNARANFLIANIKESIEFLDHNGAFATLDMLRKEIIDPLTDIGIGVCYATTPPAAQRQWVGLTVEEKVLGLMFDAEGRLLDYEEYANAIEAKLREKNT